MTVSPPETTGVDRPDHRSCAVSLPVCAVRRAVSEPAARLEQLGYRPVQAAFLAVAALLGGYFLRRHFRAFSGAAPGRAETRFLRRAVGNGHAKAVVRKALYRVMGRAVTRALRLAACPVANRIRAYRSLKQRLLALDFLLERPGGKWLLHENQKREWFTGLGVAEDCLPRARRSRAGRPRTFSDGFPVHVLEGQSQTVTFSYAHAGATETGMLRHLGLYRPLVEALVSRGIAIEWTVLADAPVQFLRLRRGWRTWIRETERDRLETELFPLRQTVEQRRWADLTSESVQRYADLRAAHNGPEVERRYTSWIASGAPPLGPPVCIADGSTYRETLLDHDYRAAEDLAHDD